MIPSVYYVHGAGASKRSFCFLKDQLDFNHTSKYFEYSVNDSLVDMITKLSERIVEGNEATFVVGHSLGGLIALGQHDLPNVERIATMGTPFGGLASAGMMTLFSKENLFKDLNPYGSIVNKLRSTKITKPMLSFVGTVGLPFTNEVNDGVVTYKSATALSGPMYLSVEVNHFELLMDETVGRSLNEFLSPVQINYFV